MGGKLYAPAGQVVHRRLADQPREALRERRTRQANFASKIVDGPLLGHAAVKEAQSPRHEAVFETREPSSLFIRERFDIVSQGFDEEQFR